MEYELNQTIHSCVYNATNTASLVEVPPSSLSVADLPCNFVLFCNPVGSILLRSSTLASPASQRLFSVLWLAGSTVGVGWLWRSITLSAVQYAYFMFIFASSHTRRQLASYCFPSTVDHYSYFGSSPASSYCSSNHSVRQEMFQIPACVAMSRTSVVITSRVSR